MTVNFKENKPIYIAVIIYLVWVIVFAATNYNSEKNRLYQSIDNKLDKAALTLPTLLPDGLHSQSMNPSDLTREQSTELAVKLSEFTRLREVIYAYTLILRDNKIYFTASSADDEELETGHGISHYFDHYDDVAPGVFDVFAQEQKRYIEYTDRWGSFRSVYIPLQAEDGALYVAAADIEVSHIQELLNKRLFETLVTAALFLVFAIPLIGAFSVASRQLAKKLELRVAERTEELVESESAVNSVLEHSPVAIVHYDAQGILLRVNRGFEKLVGKDRYLLVGAGVRELLVEEGLINAVNQSLNGQASYYEGDFPGPDNKHIRLHANFVPMSDSSGQTNGGLAVLDDCTDQYDALTSLKTLSMAVDHSPNVVFVTDRKGLIEYANPRFLEVTGYKPEEVIGLNPNFLKSGVTDPAVYKNIWDELVKGNTWSGEFKNRRKSGELYWARQSIAPIFNERDQITHFVAIQEDVTETRRIQEQNAYHATHDMLTGLVNRYEFERRLERVVETAKQQHSAHALCFVDLDQFKIINDTCGHIAGDALLRQLSAVLRGHLRKRDTLARIGGDEFAILMEHCGSDQALRVAQNIHTVIDQFVFNWKEHNFTIGSSIGMTRIDEFTVDAVEVLRRADAACYVAKEEGRNRIHIYHEDDESLARREGEMQWVNVIKRAIDRDDFTLFAQRIEPANGDSSDVSYEILIRLLNKDDALVPPGSFLPAAERYGLSASLDRWVVEHTLEWMEANFEKLQGIHHLAINLSGQSLGDEYFLDYLQKRLAETNIPAGFICFEITETAAIANLSRANQFINTLREFGCHFSLDDFGSGLSSFAYLKNLPVDYLKIDGMFVKDILDDPIDEAMVKSINEIGHVMRMMTVAEFVENDEIRERLKIIGVDFVQGYGVAMPIPLTDIID